MCLSVTIALNSRSKSAGFEHLHLNWFFVDLQKKTEAEHAEDLGNRYNSVVSEKFTLINQA